MASADWRLDVVMYRIRVNCRAAQVIRQRRADAVDHGKKEGTVYILGADERTPTPLDAAEIELTISDPVMQVTLKAAPQASDPAGKSSRFIGNHEKLGVVQEYAGVLSGVIDGTPYSGDFKEEPHGAH